ncbi:MAG: DNA-binding transcriptional regulator [Phycisphaeraceae bacterium]|nr:DNA-binding transcriptional regulator [Phycisphaeraceae bacterium]
MPAARRIFVLLDFTVTHGREVFHGISAYARAHGPWELVLGGIDALKAAAWPGSKPIHGLVAHVATEATAHLIKRSGIPAVNVSNLLTGLPIPQVVSDDRAVGRLVAEYFLDRGWRQFAFAGRPSHGYSSLRQAGFLERLTEAVGTTAPAVVDSAPRSLRRFFRRVQPPVAVMACNDPCARIVIETCGRMKLDIPGDVAVVGVDNDEILCEGFEPRLSSVALSTRIIGFRAAQLLGTMLRGDPPEAVGPIVVPPQGVITRASSDKLAVDDVQVAAAIRYITDHLTERPDVARVAEALAVSRRGLERRFKKTLGRTPGSEFRRIQIARAKFLLAGTDLSMAQTAAASGFSSAKQLSETFSRETGTAPSDYRNQFRH